MYKVTGLIISSSNCSIPFNVRVFLTQNFMGKSSSLVKYFQCQNVLFSVKLYSVSGKLKSKMNIFFFDGTKQSSFLTWD